MNSKNKLPNIAGLYFTELAKGVGVSYPTLKSWLPGLGIKLRHIKVEGKGNYNRAYLSHADAKKIMDYASERKKIKEGRRERK